MQIFYTKVVELLVFCSLQASQFDPLQPRLVDLFSNEIIRIDALQFIQDKGTVNTILFHTNLIHNGNICHKDS